MSYLPPTSFFFYIYDSITIVVPNTYMRKYVCFNLCVCILNILGSSYDMVKTYEKKHPFVTDFIQGPYNYDLFDDYCLWLSEGLLASHMNK